jgi:hypothetical protein
MALKVLLSSLTEIDVAALEPEPPEDDELPPPVLLLLLHAASISAAALMATVPSASFGAFDIEYNVVPRLSSAHMPGQARDLVSVTGHRWRNHVWRRS